MDPVAQYNGEQLAGTIDRILQPEAAAWPQTVTRYGGPNPFSMARDPEHYTDLPPNTPIAVTRYAVTGKLTLSFTQGGEPVGGTADEVLVTVHPSLATSPDGKPEVTHHVSVVTGVGSNEFPYDASRDRQPITLCVMRMLLGSSAQPEQAPEAAPQPPATPAVPAQRAVPPEMAMVDEASANEVPAGRSGAPEG